MKKFLPLNRFFLFSSLLLTSFFLLSSNVRAETLEFNYTSTDFDHLTNLNTLISTTDSYISSSGISYQYVIAYRRDSSIYISILFPTTNNLTSFISSGNFYLSRVNNQKYCTFNSLMDSLTCSNSSSAIGMAPSKYFILYISSSLFFNSTDNNVLFNYNSNSYAIGSNGNHIVPSLNDLNEIFNSSQLSQDNTPILTSFYSVVSSKIIFLAESVISNYILLSIFVILILIFLIELIRRYLL